MSDSPSVHLLSVWSSCQPGPREMSGYCLAISSRRADWAASYSEQGAEDIGPAQEGPAADLRRGQIGPEIEESVERERDTLDGFQGNADRSGQRDESPGALGRASSAASLAPS